MTSSKLSELKKAVNLERLNDGHVKTLIECLELAQSTLINISRTSECFASRMVCENSAAEIESKLGGLNNG